MNLFEQELIQQSDSSIMDQVRDFITFVTEMVSKDNFLLLFINGLMVAIVVFALLYYLSAYTEEEKRRAYLLGKRIVKAKDSFYLKVPVFNKLYADTYRMLADRGRTELANVLTTIFVSIIIALGLVFLLLKIYLLALLAPTFILYFIRKFLSHLTHNKMRLMEQSLPNVIDNFIRIASNYSDVKSIIHEVAKDSPSVLTDDLMSLSRRMHSTTPRVAIEEFIDGYHNVWMRSFGFTILSYLEDADKAVTMNNLRHIRDMLYTHNENERRIRLERRYGVMVNYVLLIASVAAFVGNLIFNPEASGFFFHTFGGLLVLMGGFGCVFGTILYNFKTGKKGA